MVALEDAETQRKGFVSIIYNVNTGEANFKEDVEIVTQGARSLGSLPWKLAAIHYCYDNRNLLSAVSLAQKLVGKEGRLRFRTHFGTFSIVCPAYQPKMTLFYSHARNRHTFGF